MQYFSFIDLLRGGDIPPVVFGTPRLRVLEQFGTPNRWSSRDEPNFSPPKRDYRTADFFSYGSLGFGFDHRDELDHISIILVTDFFYPEGFRYFPHRTTRISEVLDLMRGFDIGFTDVSGCGDCFRTESGVQIYTGFHEGEAGFLSGVLSNRNKIYVA